MREQIEHERGGPINVRRLARKCGPPKWPAPFAKKGANISGHEPRKIVSVLHSLLERESPNVISVIERDRSQLLQRKHAFHMFRHRLKRTLAIRFRIALAQLVSLSHVQPLRNISADRIVRAGL